MDHKKLKSLTSSYTAALAGGMAAQSHHAFCPSYKRAAGINRSTQIRYLNRRNQTQPSITLYNVADSLSQIKPTQRAGVQTSFGTFSQSVATGDIASCECFVPTTSQCIQTSQASMKIYEQHRTARTVDKECSPFNDAQAHPISLLDHSESQSKNTDFSYPSGLLHSSLSSIASIQSGVDSFSYATKKKYCFKLRPKLTFQGKTVPSFSQSSKFSSIIQRHKLLFSFRCHSWHYFINMEPSNSETTSSRIKQRNSVTHATDSTGCILSLFEETNDISPATLENSGSYQSEMYSVTAADHTHASSTHAPGFLNLLPEASEFIVIYLNKSIQTSFTNDVPSNTFTPIDYPQESPFTPSLSLGELQYRGELNIQNILNLSNLQLSSESAVTDKESVSAVISMHAAEIQTSVQSSNDSVATARISVRTHSISCINQFTQTEFTRQGNQVEGFHINYPDKVSLLQKMYGEYNVAPNSHGESDVATYISGEYDKAPNIFEADKVSINIYEEHNISGESYASPKCHVESDVAPKSHGERDVAPDSHGESDVAPSCHGERDLAPNTHGESGVAPNSDGESDLAPNIYGENNAEPNISGENNVEYKIPKDHLVASLFSEMNNLPRKLERKHKLSSTVFEQRLLAPRMLKKQILSSNCSKKKSQIPKISDIATTIPRCYSIAKSVVKPNSAPKLTEELSLGPSISKETNLAPTILKKTNLAPNISTETNLAPIISKETNLVPNISREHSVKPKISESYSIDSNELGKQQKTLKVAKKLSVAVNVTKKPNTFRNRNKPFKVSKESNVTPQIHGGLSVASNLLEKQNHAPNVSATPNLTINISRNKKIATKECNITPKKSGSYSISSKLSEKQNQTSAISIKRSIRIRTFGRQRPTPDSFNIKKQTSKISKEYSARPNNSRGYSKVPNVPEKQNEIKDPLQQSVVQEITEKQTPAKRPNVKQTFIEKHKSPSKTSVESGLKNQEELNFKGKKIGKNIPKRYCTKPVLSEGQKQTPNINLTQRNYCLEDKFSHFIEQILNRKNELPSSSSNLVSFGQVQPRLSQSTETRFINQYCQTDFNTSPNSVINSCRPVSETPVVKNSKLNHENKTKTKAQIFCKSNQNNSLRLLNSTGGVENRPHYSDRIGYTPDLSAVMKRPRSVICSSCGREFGTAYIRIHEKQCQSRLKEKNTELPKHQN